MKGSPEKILTFLKLSDCLLTVEHGQKINSYNLSHIEYPSVGNDAGAGVCDNLCDGVCCGEGSGKVKDRHW